MSVISSVHTNSGLVLSSNRIGTRSSIMENYEKWDVWQVEQGFSSFFAIFDDLSKCLKELNPFFG